MNRLIITSSILLLTLSTTACQTARIPAERTTPLAIISKEAQKALIEQQAFRDLAQKNQNTLAIRQSRIDADILVVDYIGAPQPLLESTALHYGYRYLENGKPSELPIINFNKSQVTGKELLKQIGTLLSTQANVVLDQNNKTILLSYN